MALMFDGTAMFKIALTCWVVGALCGGYVFYKARKFFGKKPA